MEVQLVVIFAATDASNILYDILVDFISEWLGSADLVVGGRVEAGQGFLHNVKGLRN